MSADPTIISDLLDRWEEAREDGLDVPLEELCADCPELLPTIKRQIAALRAVDTKLKAQHNESDEEPGASKQTTFTSSFAQLKLHARGGLGVVYSGDDERLHRQVALKFLRQRLVQDDASRQQFALEAEITSRLEHPGIVPVYGIGETADRQLFYAMRFVQGETMDDALARFHEQSSGKSFDERGAAFRGLLQHFVSLCKTIAYAHNRGVVHRDIKPANVMLGRYGETLVVDWGLATPVGRDARFKLKDEHTLLVSGSSRIHSSNSQVGTPAYMSPEQVSGSDALRPDSDIYSLGASFYKVLTGRIPFDAPTMPEMRQRIIRGEFDRPSRVRAGVPKALEAICLKAMAARVEDRYATALELAGDIERYMADDAVAAYHEPLGMKLARWTRRHRVAAQLSAIAGVIALIGGLVFSGWMATVAQSEQAAKVDAENARQAAEAALRVVSTAEARTVATALAYQMELRLSVVEQAARDSQLVALVEQAAAEPDNRMLWRPVSDWLEGESERWSARNGFSTINWFVNLNDGEGTQIGRAPLFDADGNEFTSIGTSLNKRQYFRGGSAAPPSDEALWAPITGSFIAAPHRSSNSNEPKATFTAPIRSASGETIGVVGIGIEVYELTSLDAELGDDSASAAVDNQLLTLFYAKPDFFDEERGRESAGGLIMQHDAFRSQTQGGAGRKFEALYLDEALVERLKGQQRRPLVVEDYRDPLSAEDPQYGGIWTASLAPVMLETFEGRDPSVELPGWYVLVQRRPAGRVQAEARSSAASQAAQAKVIVP